MSEQTIEERLAADQIDPVSEADMIAVEAAVAATRAAIEEFRNDPRHARYIECKPNKDLLIGYLDEHNLGLSAETLHLAFSELGDKLRLYAESKIATPAPRVVETLFTGTHKDDGSTLAAQQAARKQQTAPQQTHRNAFIRAAQNQPPVRIKGGRFHL